MTPLTIALSTRKQRLDSLVLSVLVRRAFCIPAQKGNGKTMEGESQEPCVSFPRRELLGVQVRVELAVVMAAKGHPDEGYSSLLIGLGRAMDLTDAGEP